jgi:hypothetical protein
LKSQGKKGNTAVVAVPDAARNTQDGLIMIALLITLKPLRVNII